MVSEGARSMMVTQSTTASASPGGKREHEVVHGEPEATRRRAHEVAESEA